MDIKIRGGQKKLRINVDISIEWIANKNPPCAAYQEFMSGLLITLDKRLGILSVDIRETC